MNQTISIVTVSYNAVNTIEQAILSVVNQTYHKIEYIIIDGGSTDGTTDIIKKYEKKINYWISEKDDGIYDAMNKAIRIATGEYIYFLGADDCLYEIKTIEEVVQYFSSGFDLICGNVYFIEKEKNYLQIKSGGKLDMENILSGGMTPHQGMFVKTSLMKKYFFDITYRIGSDYDFFLKMNLQNRRIIYIENIIAFFSNDGISGSNIKSIYQDFNKILIKHKVDHCYLDNLKLRFKPNVWRMILKKFFRFIGCMEYIRYKLNYTKHRCQWELCRWCKSNGYNNDQF